MNKPGEQRSPAYTQLGSLRALAHHWLWRPCLCIADKVECC